MKTHYVIVTHIVYFTVHSTLCHRCRLKQTINDVYLTKVWWKRSAAAPLPICSSLMVSTRDQSGL